MGCQNKASDIFSLSSRALNNLYSILVQQKSRGIASYSSLSSLSGLPHMCPSYLHTHTLSENSSHSALEYLLFFQEPDPNTILPGDSYLELVTPSLLSPISSLVQSLSRLGSMCKLLS